ncbi:MAG TPA: prephenate dehydrogenase/arogenate dehydrogenase family protein [Gemmatimonadales bacterium]
MRPTRLGIIGLGAIGGSLGRQAKRAGVPTVLGWSPEPAERVRAVQEGALDDAPARPEEVAGRVELLVLAAPPAANLALLDRLHGRLAAGAIVTDTGSVKRGIVARAETLRLAERFAGSHPLAGTHQSGFGASRGDLFTNAIVYVTPAGGGDQVAREIAHFWESVCHAHAVTLPAATHDAQLAVSSHLPQVVGSLLAHFLAARLPRGAELGPGARDTTRLAASDPQLWTEILLLNRDHVLPALRALEEPLGALERALEAGDAKRVAEWLATAAVWRRNVES